MEKFLKENNLKLKEIIYEDYATLQKLFPSGAILYYNNTWCYVPQSYVDNWTKTYPYILNCLDFNKD